MTKRDPEILSEKEADHVWGRAAELQAEAAGVEAPEVTGDATPPQGHALSHVRAAALEAGIASEFMETALAELRTRRALPTAEKSYALARRFLNEPPNTITVQRTVEATPEDTFSAMQAVFPAEPFRLTLTDQQGDPLDGGVLVFDIPGMRGAFERGFIFEAQDGGLRQVFVSLRPIEGTPSSCEMTLHSPVTSHNIGLGIGMLAGTLGGGAGFAAFSALGLVAGIGPVAGIGGALLGGALGVKGFRALYHFTMRRSRRALEGLVGAVAARAKGVWRS